MPDETVQTEQLVNEEQIECLIGNVTLPVPPRHMRIKQALKIDEIEIKGRSGKIKQPIGYQDAQITIDLEICNKEEGGKVYVGGVMPLPKGMTAPPLQNDTLDWGIDDLGNDELWNKLYPWVQNKIMESYEYKAWASGGDADENQDDGECPPF